MPSTNQPTNQATNQPKNQAPNQANNPGNQQSMQPTNQTKKQTKYHRSNNNKKQEMCVPYSSTLERGVKWLWGMEVNRYIIINLPDAIDRRMFILLTVKMTTFSVRTNEPNWKRRKWANRCFQTFLPSPKTQLWLVPTKGFISRWGRYELQARSEGQSPCPPLDSHTTSDRNFSIF